MLTALAGIGMLGLATQVGSASDRHGGRALRKIQESNRFLVEAEDRLREGRCIDAQRLILKAQDAWGNAIADSEGSDRGMPGPGFVTQNLLFRARRLQQKHCVRRKPVEREVLKAELAQKSFSGLEGAAKVCIQYFRGPSGKVRCKQWSSGPGYTPGPQPEGTYRIQDVRDHYAASLCSDPRNKKKCGLSRKYRYRRSLPYLPREVATRSAPVPRVSRPGVVQIIQLGPQPAIRANAGER